MRVDDFDFELPQHLIAQAPAERRDASRLLRLDRSTGATEHRSFAELPSLLRRGDLVVLNDARVIPARLIGKKETGGRAELLVVRPDAEQSTRDALAGGVEQTLWRCIGQASKGFKPGQRIAFDGGLEATIDESFGGGEYRVRFAASSPAAFAHALERAGQLPLPPYIERPPNSADAERYQTVYARSPGSVAAPTAGLHFTEAVFTALEARGVERTTVTLDVGPGTFLPVREELVEKHVMHPERFTVPPETAGAIAKARSEGRRIVAVGTTVVRTLESATREDGTLASGPGETRLFITPGFRFRQIDVLITNFHLPRSTLLMLVSAFAGTDRVLAAYREAVTRAYRFFSYGDAMLIEDSHG